MSIYVVASNLPLRYCSRSPAPLHLSHSHGTLTRAWPSSRCRRFSRVAPVGAVLARKCSEPSNSTAHEPVLLLLSPPIHRQPCMPMEYPDFGPRHSFSTDSPMWRSDSPMSHVAQRLAYLL